MQSYTLYNGDCLEYMKKIKSSSVDLIVTDPPYNLGKFMENRDTNLGKMRDNFFGIAGWDDLGFKEWKNSMNKFFHQAARVLKDGGSMIVFMSIIKVETLIAEAEKNGFYYKTTGIWHKLNPMPRNMNLHFVNSTEAWIYFTYKSRTGTFNNDGKVLHDFVETSVTPKSERKYGKHPTQKPEQLMEHFVSILSDENNVVLDPFMGSGSVGVAAVRLKRKFIGIELEESYYNIASSRIMEVNTVKGNKVIDLFAGVGGMSLGFEMAGFEVILANEYNKEIAAAYAKNHPNTKMIAEDITSLSLEEVFSKYRGEVDVVIGGPPCQGFSQKGQRKTINDERNFLFKYYVNVVELVKPRYFVMENVPNLLTAEKGFFKKEIEEMFGRLGYVLNSDVLNAADYGVPQNRRRAVIIGKLSDDDNKKVALPKMAGKKVTIWDAISDLAYLESGEGEIEQKYRLQAVSSYQKKMREGSSILYNHQATKHSKLALERLKLLPPEMGKEVLPEEHHTKSIYSGTWSRMVKNDVSVTITTRFDTPSSGRFTHPYLNRAITVREAARIQSFPDDFIFVGTKSAQMKQVGNAVPPLLAKAIAESIKKDMEMEDKHE